jgi:hypothetical protein
VHSKGNAPYARSVFLQYFEILQAIAVALREAPLDALELALTIETRFCVITKGTKADPKWLGDSGGKRGIVGCNPLLDCTILGHSLMLLCVRKDGAIQARIAPYARSALLFPLNPYIFLED